MSVDNVAIADVVAKARGYFQTDVTRPLAFRRERLRALLEATRVHESKLFEALYADLHKPKIEAYAAEIGIVYAEIKDALKHVSAWMKTRRVSASLAVMPARARIYPEPLGTALIIAPWNYPFQLAVSPLVGAIAAGCNAVVKPSELAPATATVLRETLAQAFGTDGYVTVVEGGAEISQQLLAEQWDVIFFTGSTRVGGVVMRAAAERLTPVVLELGGKSPTIVDEHVDLVTTARRIVWGKYFNAGQTCIAPDYVLVHRNVKEALLEQLGVAIGVLYGREPKDSADYARIISSQHFARLQRLMSGGRVVHGGLCDGATRYIAPTVLTDVDQQHALMQEEIFGPLLPVVEVPDIDAAISYVRARPKPLSLYVFSSKRSVSEKVLRQTSSGGAAVNDTLLHAMLPKLPFGGVGGSGMGAYHSKASFEVFSHYKSVLDKPFVLDVKTRYPPYRVALGLFRFLIG